MNLELPFDDRGPSELDEHLARIDRQLDALFFEELEGTLERLRAERDAGGAGAAVG